MRRTRCEVCCEQQATSSRAAPEAPQTSLLTVSPQVVRDQIYSVFEAKKKHIKRMQELRTRLSHKKTKAHKSGNFKVIPPVNYYMIDKVAFEISDELFDVFTWDTVKTQTQTQWKVSR